MLGKVQRFTLTPVVMYCFCPWVLPLNHPWLWSSDRASVPCIAIPADPRSAVCSLTIRGTFILSRISFIDSALRSESSEQKMSFKKMPAASCKSDPTTLRTNILCFFFFYLFGVWVSRVLVLLTLTKCEDKGVWIKLFMAYLLCIQVFFLKGGELLAHTFPWQ